MSYSRIKFDFSPEIDYLKNNIILKLINLLCMIATGCYYFIDSFILYIDISLRKYISIYPSKQTTSSKCLLEKLRVCQRRN